MPTRHKPGTTRLTGTLQRNLQQQLTAIQDLIAVTEQLSFALAEADIARVLQWNSEQQQCLEKLTLLETERRQIVRDLAWALELDYAPALRDLLPRLPARTQETLNRLREQILATEGVLERLRTRNHYLLEEALEFVRFSLQSLTTAALQPARYGTNVAAVVAPTFYIDSKA